jgi:DGQHR domain-containing protein
VFLADRFDVTEADRQRLQDQSAVLIDEHDLTYYESLVAQIGPAARYQLLADLLPGRRITALQLRVAALKAKMGGYNCYTFCLSPDHLLKIGYVSHRAKGKASDVNAYQRMLQKSRIRRIQQYITSNGIFPTNIVVNIEDNSSLRFDQAKQESDQEGATFGWLTLPPKYRSAWIIDGQHRLYAYSGHARATSSVLTILAFDGLPPSQQAQLFIDINAEQKSVKQTLLQELYAELHWDAADPQVRVRAIISKAVQVLDESPQSPFYERIRMADEARTDTRCISLASVFNALQKSGIYFASSRRGSVVEYGPLWAGDNVATLDRTTQVIGQWFEWIRDRASEWWGLGSALGGGLAMNDGVDISLDVLRSVLTHLEDKGLHLVRLSNRELVLALKPFGEALGDYLGSLGPDERKSFRELRGNQGHASGVRRCQAGIQRMIPEFDPPGLQQALEEERAQTTNRARDIILEIESLLQRIVLAELKAEYTDGELDWWFRGVPKSVRKQVDDRINEDQGQRGGREENLDLIHYRERATYRWSLFQRLLGYGKGSQSKDARTTWIVDVNETRKNVMHASRGATVSVDQLGRLEGYREWLASQADRDDLDAEAGLRVEAEDQEHLDDE